MPFGEALWASLMRTLDSGTMGGDAGWAFRLIMLFVTLGGIFVVSTLIGVLGNGIQQQMERLRKGRSRLLEADHTVVLGWSPQVFTLISELVIANENRKSGAVIAILADQDKVFMEDEIRSRIPDTRNTRIICRSGSPIDPGDIELVSPHTARSMIILPEGKDPDTHVIKAVLALTNNPGRRPEPYHIVTQVRSPKNSGSPAPRRTERSCAACAYQRPHRPSRRSDFAPIRAVSGLHGTPGLRRRRDLFHRSASAPRRSHLC